MKVGIVTYHRSHNYGALLQAVALRYQLLKMGHEVYFIDYWPLYHKQMYDFFSIKEMFGRGLKASIKYTVKILASWKSRKERIAAFNHFIERNISPYCKSYMQKEYFDVIIYGSDQIWRKQDRLSGQFNPVYFGENILRAKRHVSYAASMGNMNLEIADYSVLQKIIGKLSVISVREERLKYILRKIGVDSQVVLDPTLLLYRTDWDKLFPVARLHKNKYVLYYRLLRNSFDEKQITKFCRDKGYDLLILDGNPKPTLKKTIFSASPEEFLSLIKYAEFVFTSSYHGMVFSIIYQKPFFVSFSKNADRAKSLLTYLRIENRILSPQCNAFPNVDCIDYSSINHKLNELRDFSIGFIKKTLDYCFF